MDDGIADDGRSGPVATAEGLPRSTIAKLVKERLPPSIRAGQDALALLHDCTAEFLQMVTSEANDACNETGKKTITEEHVIAALRKLDFDRFASECAGIGGEEQDAKAAMRERKKKRKQPRGNLTPEELLAEQQALFAGARQRMDGSTGQPAQE